MNKFVKYLFAVFVFYFFIIMGVNAVEDQNKLYSISESSSTATNIFTYNSMSYTYDPNSDSSQFNFGSIVNNTDKSQYVSINILLFDKNKKNIGFATYCSEKDLDGEFSQFKIKAKESVPFNIKVSNKYFIEEKSSKDIAYYSVLDENVYCHIGGYDKYAGLTLEEISKGKISETKKTLQQEVIELSGKINYALIFTALLILIVSYVVTGIILNELNKRMNATSTPIAYIPIGNNYLAVSLAFGTIIGKIYLMALVASFVLFFFGFRFLYYILSFVSSAAFILDIIKLITKKYDLLVFEPVTRSYITTNVVGNTNDQGNNTLSENQINVNADYNAVQSQDDNMNVSSGTGNKIIDLNYSAPEEQGTLPLNTGVNSVIGTVDNGDSKSDKEESDLSNLFK